MDIKIKCLLPLVVAAFCLAACKKYTNDSKGIHLKTVKGRLTKSWDFGGNRSYGNQIAFVRSGTFRGWFPPFECLDGKWELIEEKEKIRITYDNGNAVDYTITKLDNDALWLQSDTVLFAFKRHEDGEY